MENRQHSNDAHRRNSPNRWVGPHLLPGTTEHLTYPAMFFLRGQSMFLEYAASRQMRKIMESGISNEEKVSAVSDVEEDVQEILDMISPIEDLLFSNSVLDNIFSGRIVAECRELETSISLLLDEWRNTHFTTTRSEEENESSSSVTAVSAVGTSSA